MCQNNEEINALTTSVKLKDQKLLCLALFWWAEVFPAKQRFNSWISSAVRFKCIED